MARHAASASQSTVNFSRIRTPRVSHFARRRWLSGGRAPRVGPRARSRVATTSADSARRTAVRTSRTRSVGSRGGAGRRCDPRGTRRPRGRARSRSRRGGSCHRRSRARGRRAPMRDRAPRQARRGHGPPRGEGLVVRVVVVAGREVARDRDALARVVAEARATLGVVETEAPRVIEVECDERLRPVAHAIQFRHGGSVRRATDMSACGATGQIAIGARAIRRSAASIASSIDSSWSAGVLAEEQGAFEVATGPIEVLRVEARLPPVLVRECGDRRPPLCFRLGRTGGQLLLRGGVGALVLRDGRTQDACAEEVFAGARHRATRTV